ncbi:MAG: TetR/AcrR family transcriptional regulator [Treponema sp.]|nr:TetR/AcrR family transcriptional regulator [Treponema sp.]
MPRHSDERTENRRQEIINACRKLYKTMGFRDITLKEISTATSLSRPSIYNYFETKEEIFLAIMQQEYEAWVADLTAITTAHETLTHGEFSSLLAHSLENRPDLLKLMSMNHFDMEENSRLERLVEFKRAYGSSLSAVDAMLQKFFPSFTERQRQDFIYTFFPFIFGIYPYAVVSERQRDAITQAGLDFKYLSVYEITYNGILRLLEE